MDFVFLICLILLNGLFAMAEIALVTARRSRLQRLADDGDRAAALAVRLGEDPTRFMSTIQIGITAIGILNGIVGEAAFAAPLAVWMMGLGLEAKLSSALSTTLVVVLITYLTIVLGELVPKRIGQASSEKIARIMARPIALLATLSRPFVALLTLSTKTVLSLLGKQETSSADLTEDDIHAMLIEGSESGLIEKHEHDMVRKVFALEDRPIATLMTPRSDIIWLDVEDDLEANLQKVLDADHSRFPVCQGGLQHIVGIISAKRLLRQRMQGEIADLLTNLQPGVFVPESMTGMKLLDQFRQSGVQVVFVVNEYGDVMGLVTLQDVLEALAGEFHSPRGAEHDAWAVQRSDGSWLFDGLIPIPELKEHLGLKNVPDEDKNRYNTLSGMVMWLLGDVPKTGDITYWSGWSLEVVDMDGNRLDKVLASRIPGTEDSA